MHVVKPLGSSPRIIVQLILRCKIADNETIDELPSLGNEAFTYYPEKLWVLCSHGMHVGRMWAVLRLN